MKYAVLFCVLVFFTAEVQAGPLARAASRVVRAPVKVWQVMHERRIARVCRVR